MFLLEMKLMLWWLRKESKVMRTMIASQTYYPESNGQAVFTVQLAEGLAKRGHDVMVIVPAPGLQLVQQRRNGVEIVMVPAISLSPWYASVRVTPLPNKTVNHFLDVFRPHVVHIQDHYPLSRSVVRAARRRYLPIMGTNHFMPENLSRNMPLPAWSEKPANYLLWKSMLSIYNRLNVVTTPTKTAARLLQEQSIQVPVYPVSCGVDLNRFHSDEKIDRDIMRVKYDLSSDKVIFLFVGRIDREKRLDVLIQAMSLLRRDDVQFAIAGKGMCREALQTQVRAKALGDRVRFLGYVPSEDLPSLLNSVDIFAMPSEAELQSIATLEAMACGLPVLAANAYALPELVENGVNGYLFRPGDAVDAARRIAQLVAERERWPAMSAASLEKVQPHSVGNSILHYEQLYNSPAMHRAPIAERLRRPLHSKRFNDFF